jgi:hypothetical protein
MIAALLRYVPLRIAPLRIAPQLNAPQRNAPLGSLEPLLRLRGAEGHHIRASMPRNAAQCGAPHRFAIPRPAPRRVAPQRNATQRILTFERNPL